jgi:hypothetical protein
VVVADAGLAEEDGTAGRFAFDEGGEDEDERGGGEEADGGAEKVDGAFEGAVEEAVDGEFVDAEDGDVADGLEAETAEENVKGAGDDLPLDVGAFAGFDDVLEIGAGKIEAGDDEDVGGGLREEGGEGGEVREREGEVRRGGR